MIVWYDGCLSLNVLRDIGGVPEVMTTVGDITTTFDGNYDVGLLETFMIHSASNAVTCFYQMQRQDMMGVDIIDTAAKQHDPESR
jgi:hypothetical protein